MIEVLELLGTPRQVGRGYGEACREGFRAFHAQVREQAAKYPRWYDDIHIMGEAIASHYPRYFQELEGIAEGAGMSLDDILLNHRRLLLAEFLCCSNVAFLDTPAGPIFGKNLDGAAAVKPGPDRRFIVRHCKYETGQEVVHTTIVGDLMSRDTCMNMRGLVYGGSSVGSVYQKSLHNPTLDAGLYAMLCNCASVEEAIRFIQRVPHVGKGYNLVVADAQGNGVVLECACPMVQVRRPEPGSDVVYCTNHYNLPALSKADRRQPLGMTYSRKRWEYLTRKLHQQDTPRTVEGMKGMLSAHGAGGGLCRPIDEGDPSVTLMSVIALPETREFWVANGRPVEVAYKRII